MKYFGLSLLVGLGILSVSNCVAMEAPKETIDVPAIQESVIQNLKTDLEKKFAEGRIKGTIDDVYRFVNLSRETIKGWKYIFVQNPKESIQKSLSEEQTSKTIEVAPRHINLATKFIEDFDHILGPDENPPMVAVKTCPERLGEKPRTHVIYNNAELLSRMLTDIIHNI